MKLEGSLDAFSLPDIFQLLSFTKKTGGLHLASGGADGVVYFADGQVTGASADNSRQPLARRLVGGGMVDDDALGAAVEAAAGGEHLGVIRALVEAGAVDADLVRHAATDQTIDAVLDLLRWEDGDFVFVVDEPNPDDIDLRLGIEPTLGDAESRRAQWESVSQVVPSPDAVLTVPVTLERDPALSREEWSLLALVDGRRTVADLVDLTGAGRYSVVPRLAELVDRGLLAVRDTDDPEPDYVTRLQRRQGLLAPLESFVPAVDPSSPGSDPSRDSNGATPAEDPVMLGGAHVPEDVVPPRPEPFLPRRQADFAEGDDAQEAQPATARAHLGVTAGQPPAEQLGDVVGATVTAPDPSAPSAIQRDPSVNRALMLRLIAGVRGL